VVISYEKLTYSGKSEASETGEWEWFRIKAIKEYRGL